MDEGAKNKKALAIVIASLLILLGLATWGGIKLGASGAANQVQDQKAKLESATEQLSQSRSASTTLQTQLESVQADLAQSQSYISALQQNDATLRTQLTSAQAQLSQTQSQYGSLQDSNAALQTQLASAQTQLSQMQSQYGSLQNSNAALQTQLTSAQQTIAALQAQLASAQQTIAALQAQLAAWYAWYRNPPSNAPTTTPGTGPSITLSSTSGAAGTTITVTGSGFAANTYGGVFFDINRNGTHDSGEPTQYLTTSSGGTFSTTLIVPSVPPTAYPVTADFPIGPPAEASATFTVTT